MIKEKIYITDVSPRDGLQNQNQFVSTDDKYLLIEKLVEAGLQQIEVTSFVSPKAVPMLADAKELVERVLLAFPKLNTSVLVPNIKGVEQAIASGVGEVALVLCATDTMNRKNINKSLEETITAAKQMLDLANQNQIKTRAYIGVSFDCPYEGRVPKDRIIELTKMLYDQGTDQIVIADTIGSADPSMVQDRMDAVLKIVPQSQTVIHLHNTRGMAVANAWAALQSGVRWFDASVAGIGGCPFAPGAAGNMATEDLILLATQSGFETNISIPKLLQAVDHAETILAKRLGGGSVNWLRQNAAKFDV